MITTIPTLRATPVESYSEQGRTILVKREDLCAPDGAPPFSKIRGLLAHLSQLKAEGVTTVGYVETSISMAGWGVAWACEQLGLDAVIYDPQYKCTPAVLAYHRKQWARYPVTLEPIQAGMARVNWNVARRRLSERYGTQAVLLPLGLPLLESITATAAEAALVAATHQVDVVVVNVGSGTIAAGVWRGLAAAGGAGTVYGVMGRTGDVGRKRRLIEQKAGLSSGGLFSTPWEFRLEDPGWQYTTPSTHRCPFPCHAYYDRKAWQWLCENLGGLDGQVLFWNIGH